MTEPLLTVDNLRVDYVDTTAVRDVSFAVGAGEVYGLIGPNGAGKTSILSAAATLVEPTYGSIMICGVPVFEERENALPRLGFMPDFPPLIEDLSLAEFLELFASAYGIARAERAGRIERVLALTGLTSDAGKLSGGLSRGMKQRLFLAKTLLHDPDVLLLDEPASGLDPGARKELTDTICGLAQEGKAVVVSSHILSEMEAFCSHVGMMDAGSLVLSGRISDVLQGLKPGRAIRLSLVQPDLRLAEFLSRQPHVRDVEATSDTASFHLEGGLQEAAGLLRSLVQSDFALADFSAQEGGLQEIFEEVSGGGTG